MSNVLEISSLHHFEEAEYYSSAQKLDLLADKICEHLETLLTSKKASKPAPSLLQLSLEQSEQRIKTGILAALSNGEKSKEELYIFFNRNVEASTLNLALDNLLGDGRIQMDKRKAKGKGKRPKTVFWLCG